LNIERSPAASTPLQLNLPEPSSSATFDHETRAEQLFERAVSELEIATRILSGAVGQPPWSRAAWVYVDQLRLLRQEVVRLQAENRSSVGTLAELVLERLVMARQAAINSAQRYDTWYKFALAVNGDAESIAVPDRFVTTSQDEIETVHLDKLLQKREHRSWFSEA
jgi:hypothetical protein